MTCNVCGNATSEAERSAYRGRCEECWMGGFIQVERIASNLSSDGKRQKIEGEFVPVEYQFLVTRTEG